MNRIWFRHSPWFVLSTGFKIVITQLWKSNLFCFGVEYNVLPLNHIRGKNAISLWLIKSNNAVTLSSEYPFVFCYADLNLIVKGQIKISYSFVILAGTHHNVYLRVHLTLKFWSNCLLNVLEVACIKSTDGIIRHKTDWRLHC